MSQSSITISGTISKKAEQRFTQSNVSIVAFTMKVLRYNGKTKEEKAFPVRVNLWGDNGVNILERLNEGIRVIVSGRLQINQFNDQAGNPVRLAEVEASQVNFVEDLAKLDTSSIGSEQVADFDSATAEQAPASASPQADEKVIEEIPF